MMRMLHDPISGNLYGFDDDIISDMIAGACYLKNEIDTKLAAVLKLCGTKNTYAELQQLTDQEVGDVWIVVEDQAEYAWVKSHVWEKLGPVIDLSPFALKTTVGTLPTGYETVIAYVTAAKTAADNAQTALDNYKNSNDTALSNVKTTADGAVQSTVFETFKTTNTQAINAAKKAGDDAQSALDTYKTSNNQAVADAKKAGTDAAADLSSYKTSNDQAVQSAANAASGAQQTIDNFKMAQKVFEATVESITAISESTEKELTSDTVFSRRKTYYKLVSNEYVALVLGTDYQALDNVSEFGEDVYEAVGVSVTQLVSKINELVSAGNALIAAHKQDPAPAS